MLTNQLQKERKATGQLQGSPAALSQTRAKSYLPFLIVSTVVVEGRRIATFTGMNSPVLASLPIFVVLVIVISPHDNEAVDPPRPEAFRTPHSKKVTGANQTAGAIYPNSAVSEMFS